MSLSDIRTNKRKTPGAIYFKEKCNRKQRSILSAKKANISNQDKVRVEVTSRLSIFVSQEQFDKLGKEGVITAYNNKHMRSIKPN